MSYDDPEFSRKIRALRKEANCRSTDEYIEWLERWHLAACEVYETVPKIIKERPAHAV